MKAQFRKLTAALLVAMFLATMTTAMPALAMEKSEPEAQEVYVQSYAQEPQGVNLLEESDDRYNFFEEGSLTAASSEEEVSTRAYPSTAPECAIYTIEARPAVKCEETGSVWTLSSIRKKVSYPRLLTAGATVHLSPAEVADYTERVLAWFEGYQGNTYSFYGWKIVVEHRFSVGGTIKLQPYATQYATIVGSTAEKSTRVQAREKLETTQYFRVDPNLTSYTYIGLSGGYFPTGKSSSMIGSGVALNS